MLENYIMPVQDLLEESPFSILVVDDIPTNIEIMKGLLYREGYNIITALGGDEALKTIDKSAIDLAILDVLMPGMSGYELCRKLKEIYEPRFFPVILVTALYELKDKIVGLEAGADDFISKPFQTIELITKIRSLLKLKRLQEELDHSEDIILTLAIALDAKDPYTKGHSERVADLAKKLALFIGLPEQDSNFLRKACLLHDIGKIGISVSLLHKEGPLSQEEMDIIRKHPIIGKEICSPLWSLKNVLPIIRHHHERWDGKGFPDGLKGEEIPLMARILFIADAFDAMVSERPYRSCGSFPKEAVLDMMESERFLGQWDPELIGKFLEMMRKEKE